jgi:adenosylcobinamide-GDP ribazoletransferase
MIFFKRIILMIQFFTTIPIPVNIESDNEDFGKGLLFAPFIGFFLGILLMIVYLLTRIILPPIVVAAFIAAAYAILSGGLHLDGLADSFDGLFSNRSKDRMLEIMRDSRIGTNGVLGLLFVTLINFTLLYWIISSGIEISTVAKVIILIPVSGRMGSLISAGISDYARKGEGLGKSFIDFCGMKEILIGNLIALIIFFITFGGIGLLLSLIPMFSAIILTKMLTNKIDGATGDILGAVCELNQLLFLFCSVILLYKEILI